MRALQGRAGQGKAGLHEAQSSGRHASLHQRQVARSRTLNHQAAALDVKRPVSQPAGPGRVTAAVDTEVIITGIVYARPGRPALRPPHLGAVQRGAADHITHVEAALPVAVACGAGSPNVTIVVGAAPGSDSRALVRLDGSTGVGDRHILIKEPVCRL